MNQNFESLIQPWKDYNKASIQLIGEMSGTSNVVGEFAEKLIGIYYDAEQLTASNKSADLKTKEGKLIQVKSRR
ncbi:hypothetical protein EZS27_026622 [termite gut metagenome]|uniref:Uncharacterized protein n=1 Tax=termite gut metagenome TaxID=433724 RepID=A0A5J4QPX8_9ZZZZ